MRTPPQDEALAWAASALGGPVVDVRGLREGGPPWAIIAESPRGRVEAVLRGEDARAAVEHRALSLAAAHGIRVPRVLAHRGDQLLIELVDGSSAVPRHPDPARLRAFGALIARIARVPVDDGWPTRRSPIDGVDFAAMHARARHPLLLHAGAALAASAPPAVDGFVHGDLWHGNTLWRGADVVAVIDWDHAGRGPEALDLASVRFDAALYFGEGAEQHVLDGWREEAGREPRDLAHADVVAAHASPPDLAWFVPTIIEDGRRPDLDRATLIARRDAFLENALARLSARG